LNAKIVKTANELLSHIVIGK